MIEYTYDNMYNRISKTEDGTVTVYEYDANNRLIRQGEETLEYDNNGNLIRQYGGVNERTYTYNHDNRLVKAVVVQENNILSEEYEYDCEGSRILKITNEVDVTKYIVDSNTEYADVLAELDTIISDYYRKPPDNYLYNNCQVVIFMDKILIHYKNQTIHYIRRFLSIFCDIIYARLNLREFYCVDASCAGFPFALQR